MSLTSRAHIAVLTLATLMGCATTPTPVPSPGTGLSCEPLDYKGPFPEAASPETWNPEPCPRGFVSLRFVVDGGHVYAIGVRVNEREAGTPFVVGPMTDLKSDLPTEEAVKAGMASKDWHAFYGKLFKACGGSRPLALVCPRGDCPITPEIPPPPGVLGMTASYGPGAIASLQPAPTGQAYAALDAAGPAPVATDAAMSVLANAQRTPEREKARRDLIADTVARAACAAKILTVPR